MSDKLMTLKTRQGQDSLVGPAAPADTYTFKWKNVNSVQKVNTTNTKGRKGSKTQKLYGLYVGRHTREYVR